MIKNNYLKKDLVLCNWKLISFILLSFWIISYGYCSPCPNVLTYQYDGQRWSGRIIVFPNPEQQIYNLTVKILTDLELFWPNIGHIEVIGTYNEILAAIIQGSQLIFKLNLPYDTLLNQITEITLNNIVLCKIYINVGYNVKEITLYHTLRKFTSYDPQIQNSITNFQDEQLFNTHQLQFQSQLPKVDFPHLSVPQREKNYFQNGFSIPINQLVTTPSIEISKHIQTISTTDKNIYDQQNVKELCGSTVVIFPLIKKGNETLRGEFPWMVTLFKTTPLRISFICAGSLISRQHVVTAAHCIKIGRKLIKNDELVVFLGKYNLRDWGEKLNVAISVKEIHIHPEFSGNPVNFVADIAIITLEEKVTFTSLIRPICLWNGPDELTFIEGFNGTVAGWGKDETGKKLSSLPKKIQLPIVSQIECIQANKYFTGITSTRTFCAGRRDGAGPCSGDSGSGFLLEQNNRWVLRGIVSVSLEDKKTYTCDLNQYLIFTDVAKFRSWISNITDIF